jgi:hypothetical protein
MQSKHVGTCIDVALLMERDTFKGHFSANTLLAKQYDSYAMLLLNKMWPHQKHVGPAKGIHTRGR